MEGTDPIETGMPILASAQFGGARCEPPPVPGLTEVAIETRARTGAYEYESGKRTETASGEAPFVTAARTAASRARLR